LGPTHPATHGIFQNILKVDGERILSAEPTIGYIHRAFEKLAERRPYNQITPITDRLNYCSSPINNIGWHLTVEKLAGIEVPKRVDYMRVIVMELARIADHLVCNSVIGVDMDADAIRYGNHRYKNDKIVRHIADATHFTHSIKFDVIVCFETIEHIKDYQGLINNLYNNLNVGGLLLISSPITKITNTNPNNPYHVIEWNFYDFQNLFLEKFKVKEILLQNIILNRFRMNVIFKVINKVFRYLGFSNLISNIVQGKDFEVYTNQYNMNLCDSGYQMLVLEKL
jgi:SAM-dependent methyltransferase